MIRFTKLVLVTLFTSLSLTACLTEEELLEEDLGIVIDEDEFADEDEIDEDEDDELAKPQIEHADVPRFPTQLGSDEILDNDAPIPCDPPVPPLDKQSFEGDDEIPPKPYGYDASEVPDADEDCEDDDEDCEDDDGE